MKSNLNNINLARNMPAIRDSLEIMSDKQFSNINQPPKRIAQRNERRNSVQPAQTFAQHSTGPSSTQRTSKPDNNVQKRSPRRGDVRKDGAENRSAVPTPAANPKSKQTSDNAATRVYQWFAQCCRKKEVKPDQHGKKKRNCFTRWREKYRKRKGKKKTSFKRETSIIERTEDAVVPPVAVVPQNKRRKNGRADKIQRAKARRKSGESETGAVPVRTFQTESDDESVKGLPPEIDFKKSCCYLCAQNTMAIAAALSGKVEKLHISIQASTRETFTSDKGCSPSVNARTVKSSVKVKTRDMSTSSPGEKKSKRPKLKLKKLNILPKLKLAVSPKQRTVGCETDKSVRCKNMAKCKGNRDLLCVKDANAEKTMDGK